MQPNSENDYVLGTHDEEIARLGLQHRVWRNVVLDGWRKAGIAAGSRVLDVGAGPGHATMDLAELVGPTGEVVAVERSARFARAAAEACRSRQLSNVRIHQLDLMTSDLPSGPFDASWCRWVASFVASPAMLVAKLAGVIRKGGVAIFHEYADYATFRFSPRRPALEQFVRHVMASWRAAGGEPDVALELPALLAANGFVVRSATPHILCVRPGENAWRWPAGFIELNLARLHDLGRVDASFIEQARQELAKAEADPTSLMLTPLLMEIIAEKVG